jgi:DNA-directed RNA polymerase specialized sigma24 family protein
MELPNQAATIGELHLLGFDNDRIAELLGTTPDTVRSSLNKAKARSEKTSAKDTP